ncbi:hypothetical protein HMPREF1531_01018 [Propionibacterium sp. oral taxon 192 str. F0372]|uniref:ABC transporter ATP-binding protein n=1 Tax=Propionibacterium sp. oral taxon 192 TaxID=671222 RepID=UPI000354860C|nr:ABC transporter ATP-binding protein [Propionibacterium sp. oral taxon 192]EPH05589.1 hypothetical protein HMPREF1531_01018 [Propionibacterium sp. oral taxon 192 str. F0372]
MTSLAIETNGLEKKYGRRRGLVDLNLQVPQGTVFGFIGPNGAGKSTTIRILLNLIQPTGGTATVLGRKLGDEKVAVRRQIGYLPGTLILEGRQKVKDLLAYLGNLRGGVDRRVMDDLCDRLELDVNASINKLSKGNKQKVGIVQAFMHQPELLILDEPTSGLDPLLQHTFLELVEEAHRDGRTVFMSSHVLSEVQQTAQVIGVIREGRMVKVQNAKEMHLESLRRVDIEFAESVPREMFVKIPGLKNLNVAGNHVNCDLVGSPDQLVKVAARFPMVSLLCEEPDLEETFYSYYEMAEKNAS